MTTPAKKAAPRLGPNASAASSQPPWAMISPDGADLYLPTKQEDAIAYAREFGAQPVDPSGFPWPSILNDEGKIEIGDAPTPPDGPEAPESEQGGPTDPGDAPTPPAATQPAQRRAKHKPSADLLGYCPTPDMCFPNGLPENCSHVSCIHGSSS